MSKSAELLDLTGVACPVNTARILLQLAQMSDGSCLDVILDDGEPMKNVPLALEDEGHKIIAKTRKAQQWKITVQKSS